jgi:hypothetical protein
MQAKRAPFRAISGPLTPVSSGRSRSPPDSEPPSSAALTATRRTPSKLVMRVRFPSSALIIPSQVSGILCCFSRRFYEARSGRRARCGPDRMDLRVRLRLVPRRRCCQHRAMVNVTVEARNDVDTPGLVKLQSDTWELNIWATTDELWKLADIEKTDWDQRRTLQVGTSAKAPVWWNERDGNVDILVGHDDVTWDFGVTVPLSTVHNLLAELGEPPEAAPAPFGPTLF